MPLTTEQLQTLNVVLNEAALLGLEVDPVQRLAAATFSVLTLPESGPPPADRRVQFMFGPVGRVMASLRMGQWNDPAAEVVPFDLADLLGVVQSFGGLDIYGWEFFDVGDARERERWTNRVSLDYRAGDDGLTHTLDLFQGTFERFLDVRLWFDELMLRNSAGEVIAWQDFAAGGQRWWDALNRGDERAQGFGIFPMK